jgi:heat shock protein HtpX
MDRDELVVAHYRGLRVLRYVCGPLHDLWRDAMADAAALFEPEVAPAAGNLRPAGSRVSYRHTEVVMVWAKRIALFVITNILVMLTISIVLQVLGLRYGMSAYGIDYRELMVFCLVWGMAGSLISLALSRVMAKHMMGVQVISPDTRDPNERALLDMVHTLARGAGLPAMPEVGYYDSPEVNAFATGPTKSRALVAVSKGLLEGMRRDEVEGVLGHELTHVANGDMVTMTLLQGVVNAFVLFFARVIAFAVSQGVREESRGMVQFAVIIVLQIVLGLLGAIVVAAFSRWREFRADRGGATLAGREKMIAALERLRRTVDLVDTRQEALATLKINGPRSRFAALFASHPPLEERIARLQQYR